MNSAELKKALRTEIKEAERQLTKEDKEIADAAITANVFSLDEYKTAKTIFSFVGTSREIDTTSILTDVLSSGKRLCVPLCVGDGLMILKELHSLEYLAIGAYGILEPDISLPTVEFDEIDFALIPCTTCNHAGARLGKGGGFYDRFLEQYSGTSAVICREALIREYIPSESHDITINIVVTDKAIYRH